jgi:hypothetical protein
VVTVKTASSTPSCFASKQEAHRCIALEAFSIAWVCSCKCHSDWLVQTAVEAADAEEHETKGLGTNVSVLVPMVLDRMPDTKESDVELQVQCHIELV